MGGDFDHLFIPLVEIVITASCPSRVNVILNRVGLLNKLGSSCFVLFKGIVHLNIIFSYMKVNKICNLDHPVY